MHLWKTRPCTIDESNDGVVVVYTDYAAWAVAAD